MQPAELGSVDEHNRRLLSTQRQCPVDGLIRSRHPRQRSRHRENTDVYTKRSSFHGERTIFSQNQREMPGRFVFTYTRQQFHEARFSASHLRARIQI